MPTKTAPKAPIPDRSRQKQNGQLTPCLKVERVPIDSVSLDPANLRKHDDINISAIAGSLKEFGQRSPIVIDGKRIIRHGNGTWTAAKQLGWTEIEVVKTDLKGAKLTAFSIAMNRTAETSVWDLPELAKTIQALAEEGFDVNLLGWEDADLADLLTFEPEPPPDAPEKTESIPVEHTCPKCGHKFG